MKSAHPHGRGGNAEQGLDARAHLAGGLIGKGHRQYAEWRQAADLAGPGDAVRQHPGFAAAGAGEHENMPRLGADGFALAIVQIIE